MKSLNVMIKPASSACNMRCAYCFYDEVAHMRDVTNSGLMTTETVDAMLENIYADLDAGDNICFVFQGGEPTLAGLDYFVYFVSATAKWEGIRVSYALQTNGTLLDAKWCAFLKEHHFLVGISYDILPDLHDAARKTAKGEGTNKMVSDAIALLKAHGVEFNVLCTLTNLVARHPGKVWSRLEKLGIDYVQFTPCLGFFKSASLYALTPKRFAEFYIGIFAYWLRDYRAGKYRSIKLLDDVVNQMILKRPTGCGLDGKCRPQMVVEADGSVYPCDFYCTDEYKLGNIAKQRLKEVLTSDAVLTFLNREPTTLPSLCTRCEYKGFCGGNCKRMRSEICCDADAAYCGYKEFLAKCAPMLWSLAKERCKR